MSTDVVFPHLYEDGRALLHGEGAAGQEGGLQPVDGSGQEGGGHGGQHRLPEVQVGEGGRGQAEGLQQAGRLHHTGGRLFIQTNIPYF